jgi:hypothetical protein
MPKLRLSEVIAEKSIDTKTLSEDIREAISRVSAQENTLDKLNAEVAKDLKAISESLKISVVELIQTLPQTGYRLRIIEELRSQLPDESLDLNRIEKLYQDIKSITSKTIPIPLLILYATQTFPGFIFEAKEIQENYINPICETLGVILENLKEDAELLIPSLDSSLIGNIIYKYEISLDELSLLIDIPIILLPWICKLKKNNEETLEFFSSSAACQDCQKTGNLVSCFLCGVQS